MFITKINTVLSVDDNTVLSVSLTHQQDALPRQGMKSQLFKIDGVTSPAIVGDQRKLLWGVVKALERRLYAESIWRPPQSKDSSPGHQ